MNPIIRSASPTGTSGAGGEGDDQVLPITPVQSQLFTNQSSTSNSRMDTGGRGGWGRGQELIQGGQETMQRQYQMEEVLEDDSPGRSGRACTGQGYPIAGTDRHGRGCRESNASSAATQRVLDGSAAATQLDRDIT